MPTLRAYLEQANGSFTSPNHPVPMSGEDMIRLLSEGPTPVPGTADMDIDPLELPVDVEEQASGEHWIVPANGSPVPAGGPYLIHHPDVTP